MQVRRGRQLSHEVQLGSLASGLPEWVEFNQLPLSKDFFFFFNMCVSKCSCFNGNPALVIRSMQFHYCTVSNPGTGAARRRFCFEARRLA